MTTRLKLQPGQKGTKKLMDLYGDALVCVRYRYDAVTGTRIKTAEIIVERKAWTPPSLDIPLDEIVPVSISFTEAEYKTLARAAGGKWDPIAKLWYIPYGQIKGTALETRVKLDARQRAKKIKSI